MVKAKHLRIVPEADRTPRLRGRAGQEQRARRLARQPLCEHCLAETPPRITPATVVNHKIPLAHGGTDDDENTENLCREHDLIVTAKQFGHRPRVPVGDDGWPIEQGDSQ